jgi:hypothetical protein
MSDIPSPVEALTVARKRTTASGTARIELFVDHTWEMPPMPRRRRGGLLRPLMKAGQAVGKRLLKQAFKDFSFRHQSAEGVLDLAERRYMLDYGSYARLYAGGKEWDGRSGRRLATLPPEEQKVPTPLWLLDVLDGVSSATDEGLEEVRGASCRHVSATTDLGRASAATPGGVAIPVRGRFEDLLALGVDVWFDDAHIRRVRFESENQTEMLELWDFGVPVDEFDWTRLPTFRSPEEAAIDAGTYKSLWSAALNG